MTTKKRNSKYKTPNTKYKLPNTKHKTPNLHFLIIGFGRFGQLALKRLKRKFPSDKFTVVDKRPDALAQIQDESVEQLLMGGISALMVKSTEMKASDWIIPAIPVHVAYEWMALCITETHDIQTMEVPREIHEQLPNQIRGENNAIYTSIADFICPDDCSEPETICTCTGKPRSIVLNEALESLKHQLFQPIVIYSRQLAPGVGGYTISDLESMMIKVTKTSGPFLLATACKCHGVIHAFRLIPSDETI